MASASPARLAANRANARKSTGPRSPAGKARSARNHTTFGFYTRGLVRLPEPVLRHALLRAAATANEFPHDPAFARLAAGYILLAAHHTYIVHNIDAFTRWMFSAADPLLWVRRHGAFLRGALHALSHLRGQLRAAERILLPARQDYYRRFGPPARQTRAATASAASRSTGVSAASASPHLPADISAAPSLSLATPAVRPASPSPGIPPAVSLGPRGGQSPARVINPDASNPNPGIPPAFKPGPRGERGPAAVPLSPPNPPQQQPYFKSSIPNKRNVNRYQRIHSHPPRVQPPVPQLHPSPSLGVPTMKATTNCGPPNQPPQSGARVLASRAAPVYSEVNPPPEWPPLCGRAETLGFPAKGIRHC